MEQEIKESLLFWNKAYEGYEGQKIDKSSLVFPESMKNVAEKFITSSKTILDFGCGAGDMLMRFAVDCRIKKAFGVENGANIVKFTTEMIEKNDFIDKVIIYDGGIKALDRFEESSLDGVIVSNVLDVVTEDCAQEIMQALIRIVKPKGLMILKINPQFTKEKYEQMGFVNFKDNLYSKNGVMRFRDMDTSKWREWFSKWFNELDYCEVPWQSDKVLDRLFLLEKK